MSWHVKKASALRPGDLLRRRGSDKGSGPITLKSVERRKNILFNRDEIVVSGPLGIVEKFWPETLVTVG